MALHDLARGRGRALLPGTYVEDVQSRRGERGLAGKRAGGAVTWPFPAPSSHLHITPGTVLQRKSRMGRDLPLHIPHTTQCRNLYWRKHAASRNKQQLELITSRTQHRGPRTIYSTERERGAACHSRHLPLLTKTRPNRTHECTQN